MIKSYSIEIEASSLDDLQEVCGDGTEANSQEAVVERFRRAGGANYDRSKFGY